MAETNSSNMSFDNSLKEAQLEKVQLEIEQLRNRNKRGEAITQYLPLFSVLIAVGGFLFGIYQFQKQSKVEQDKMLMEQQRDRETRETDQTIRIQNQVRSDLEQLLQFTQNKQRTVSEVRFILGDLKAYLEIEKNLKHSDSKSNRTRDITVNLILSVREDCDFNQLRDIKFARTLRDDWEDYELYLREDTWMNQHISLKYYEALITIYDIDPSAVRSLKFHTDRRLYELPDDGKLSSSQIMHLEEIVEAFWRHIELFDAGEVKDRHIKNFQAATCNPTLTEQLFGVKFDSRGDLMLAHCPNTK